MHCYYTKIIECVSHLSANQRESPRVIFETKTIGTRLASNRKIERNSSNISLIVQYDEQF